MLLAELTATSEAVRDERARNAKIGRLAELLRRLAPGEVAIGVAYLSGELRQRQIGVGYRSLRDLPAPAETATLEIAEADAICERIGALSGAGSQRARRDALHELFARATEPEHRFLVKLLTGELRQGAQEGVMVEAVARAAEVPRDAVRRAHMLGGDLGAVAELALADGAAGLAAVGLQVGRPIQPMLAAPGDDV
jgi:DNA ligase-1